MKVGQNRSTLADNGVNGVKLGTSAIFLGKTNVTSTVSPTTGGTDVVSTTVTVPSTSRQIRVSFEAPQILTSTPASDRFFAELWEDSTVIQRYYFGTVATGIPLHLEFTKDAPSAGSHTYKCKITKDQGSGSGTLYASVVSGGASSIQLSVELV